MKLKGTRHDNKPWWKKGDKIEYYCIAGGNDSIFKAEKIEIFGLKIYPSEILTNL